MQIPNKLHIIWIGDEHPRPEPCLASWWEKHPEWDVRVWENHDLFNNEWVNQKHIETLWRVRKWAGVADLMRYEILYKEGGVYVDADSICMRPLDNWLLEAEMFACWTNEFDRARLVSNSFMGSVQGNPFLRFVIERAAAKRDVLSRWSWSRLQRVKMGAWRSVGPYHLTECIRRANYNRITILPSHMFQPQPHRGRIYDGGGIVYADHLWGTTTKSYAAMLCGKVPYRSLWRTEARSEA